jgi:homospermidine synthase
MEGPRNAAYLAQPGVSVLVKSWVPEGGQFNGFLIQHSEAITMSEYFTTADGSYRPTIYYAYQPCDAAILSVHEMRGAELRFHRRTRIAKNSIVAGRDELGVLLLGHGLNAYWYGSQLTIDEARELIPGENATSIQVGASILGAMTWAFENPDRGYLEPESLPHDFVLKIAKPYLGTVAGIKSDWTPLKDRNSLYKHDFDEANVWSFENFRV